MRILLSVQFFYKSKTVLKVKEESKKIGLKLNIQKAKIKTSSLIIIQQIDSGTMGTATNFFGGGGLQNYCR